jgi:hypothetical protein
VLDDTFTNQKEVAMVNHFIGKEEIIDALGVKRLIDKYDRHYLSLSDLEKTSWFKDFKEGYDQIMEEYRKKKSKEVDELYQREYLRSLDKEK